MSGSKLFFFCLVIVTISCFPTEKQSNDIDLSHYGSKIFGKPNEETGKLVSSWSTSSNVNPEELGEYLEGDILIPPSKSRNGLVALSSRWDGGIIPYVIRGSFSNSELETIQSAMKQYHDNTCIRFRRKQPEDVDYINIINSQTGCWSSVGKIGGAQDLNLQSPGCLTTVGTPVHELMHAVGFHHEQTRSERDNYVKIMWNNIRKGHEGNFQKLPASEAMGFGIDYDYGSVMHYSGYAFTNNQQPTIVTTDKSASIGQRDGFSVGDIRKIRNMYNCSRAVNTNTAAGSNKPSRTSSLTSNYWKQYYNQMLG